MANLLEQAINSNDGDHAAKLIQEALGIESDDVVNYVFPRTWPTVSSALGSSAKGCRLRRVFLPEAAMLPMLHAYPFSFRQYRAMPRPAEEATGRS